MVYRAENILRIHLGADLNITSKPYLSPRNATRFNLFVRKKIREESIVFIRALMNYQGKEIEKCIREFQIQYGFREEDLPLERIKKAFYRYRNEVAKTRLVKDSTSILKNVPQN